MSSIETNAYEASSYDADQWGQYRSLSTLAVVAFVLGLCSAAMFAGPLLVVVPLAAVATALLALKGIAASEGGLSGARLAWWGLAFAIVFSVASFARVQVRDQILQRQADQLGQQWLALAAEGRAEDMLQLMTRTAAEKLTPAVEPGQAMSFFGGILASALIRQDPLVVSLMELREGGENKLPIIDASIEIASKPPRAVFRYAVSKADPQQTCLMVLKRFQAPGQEAVWLVDSWLLE